MAESNSSMTVRSHIIHGRFSPFYPFRLVGRGIRGLVRKGMRLGQRRGGSSPVASMSGAFLPAPAYHDQEQGHDISRLLATLSFSEPLRSSNHPSFPVLFAPPGNPFAQQPQRLLTVGTRQWGGGKLAGGLLNVRLYDYALYVNTTQVHNQLGACLTEGAACPVRGRDPTQQLNASSIDMAVTIRAARNLPIPLISKEYQSVLRRRLAAVGASPNDPALSKMLSFLNEDHLPPNARHGNSIKKGTNISFVRSSGGRLTTVAGGKVMGSLHSPALCKAMFDLYLGNQAVSETSKAAATEALTRMASDPGEMYRLRSGREKLVCQRPDLEACVVQLN